MRPTVLADTLEAMIALRRPVLIEGSPGLGKTAIPKQVAAKLGLGVVLFHAPTMQPEDVAIPAANADKTALEFLPNSRFPLEGSEYPDEGVIVVDEMPQAEMSVQKSMAHLIQERDIHGRRLKPGWSIIATGNRAADRAGANRILSHLRNRVTTLEFEPQLDDWCNWALDNEIRSEIISFVRFKPGMLNDFDPQRDLNPTPRAWSEGVSPVIDNVPEAGEFEVIKGAVGEGAAAEFVGFLKICRKLPNPDTIIMNPDKAKVPDEASVRYALAGALAHRASEDNFEAIMTFAKRMPPEFTVLTVLDAVRKTPAVQNTKAFAQWAVNEGAKVLI
jgi:hypothetical protein